MYFLISFFVSIVYSIIKDYLEPSTGLTQLQEAVWRNYPVPDPPVRIRDHSHARMLYGQPSDPHPLRPSPPPPSPSPHIRALEQWGHFIQRSRYKLPDDSGTVVSVAINNMNFEGYSEITIDTMVAEYKLLVDSMAPIDLSGESEYRFHSVRRLARG
jgi:hypothetical protein